MVDTDNNQRADALHQSTGSRPLLSPSEQSVLRVFRTYLMSPGKMLCFSNAELEAFRMPLSQLSERGFLVQESFRGGYTLTEIGFAALKDCE